MILKSVLLSKIPRVKHGFSTKLGDVENELGEIHRAKQIHSAKIVEAKRAAGAEADGVYTTKPRTPVGIITADCVPILIASTDSSAVAAVHAGWRGAVAKILENAIVALEATGAVRESLRFALGPSISLDAFEVGDEVIDAAQSSLGGKPPPAFRWDNGKYHLDLRGLLIRQLEDLGVPRSHVELTGGCTLIEKDLYHSYRRDHSGGRQLSAIAVE